MVEIAGELFQRRDRRRGIDRGPRPGTERLDELNRPVQVGQDLHVHGYHRGPGVDERLHETIRFLDHQVDIEGDRDHSFERTDHRDADRQVRHEVPVHDVDVNEVGPSAFGRGNLCPELREVGCENRRSDLDLHRLTSSEMVSPGEI